MAHAKLEQKHWMRLLQPSPVVLVTSMYRSHPNVMTAAWITPMGFDPPLIAVGIHPGRLTHEFVTRSESFGISIPILDLLKPVHRCGLISGREQDKFDTCGLTPIDPFEIDAPRIHECPAHLECGVVHRLTMTDHDLFIAEIITALADSTVFNEGWTATGDSPLIHHLAAEYYTGTTRPYAVQLEDEES